MWKWQYDGVAPWSEIMDWCHANLQPGQWSGIWETVHFIDRADYVIFLLRWT